MFADLKQDAPQLARRLLAWFDRRRRDLPWRAPKGKLADPYAVWVSEVMLQQTRVEVVRSYFERWMRALPSVEHLAATSDEQVLELWQGLGYYSRARRLKAGAVYVVRDCAGRLPDTPEALRAVPGIGPYSAGAIASIAFGKRAAVVDGNVVRVLCRCFGLEGDPGKSPLKGRLWELAQRQLPQARPGDFNQALMELGATVCTPHKPICTDCPIAAECVARATGRVRDLPQLPKKAPPTPLRFAVLLARRGGRVLVERQAESARWWAGLWTFPYAPVPDGADPAVIAAGVVQERGLAGGKGRVLPELRHTITRFRITLAPVEVGLSGRQDPRWDLVSRFCTPAELQDLAMPAPHRKLSHRL